MLSNYKLIHNKTRNQLFSSSQHNQNRSLTSLFSNRSHHYHKGDLTRGSISKIPLIITFRVKNTLDFQTRWTFSYMSKHFVCHWKWEWRPEFSACVQLRITRERVLGVKYVGTPFKNSAVLPDWAVLHLKI